MRRDLCFAAATIVGLLACSESTQLDGQGNSTSTSASSTASGAGAASASHSSATTSGTAGGTSTSGTASSVGSTSGTGGGGAKVLKIIAIGDTGEGNDEQHCVADAMDKKCELVGGCDAVIMTGDNFYDHGVKSVVDPQWMTSFELPYDRKNLNGLKFYVVLGNHDYGVTSNGDKASQIDYSALPVGMGDGKRYSDKWTMPAGYYDVVLGDGLLHLFGIDTQDTAPTQLNDMKARVAASTASWKIVFGHHPRYTSGEHQLDNFLLDTISKIAQPPGMFALQQGIFCEADIFLTGHDHNRELIEKGTDKTCPNTSFIISGAGAKVRPSKYKGTVATSQYYNEDIEGFFYFELSDKEIKVESYDMDMSACAAAGAKNPAWSYGPIVKP